jgi:hypothetical protein
MAQLPPEATIKIAEFVEWLDKTPDSSWMAIPDYGLLVCNHADIKTKLEPLCIQLVIT